MTSEPVYGDFSNSVRRAFLRLSSLGPVTAGAIAVELQTLHPEYGMGRFGEAAIDPSLGPRREIAEWAGLVRSRYQADEILATKHNAIDTHLTLLALMHLDESLAASMSDAGIVGVLRSESELRPRAPTAGDTTEVTAEPRPTAHGGDHVFICYAREDSAIVREIVSELGARGVSTWIDTEDIPPGANWDRSIDEALRDTPCLMVFLSSKSVASDEVQGEWSLALDEDKAVIPVLLENCSVPRRLRSRQHIELLERPLDAGRLDRLATTLRERYAKKPGAERGTSARDAPPAVASADRDVDVVPSPIVHEAPEPTGYRRRADLAAANTAEEPVGVGPQQDRAEDHVAAPTPTVAAMTAATEPAAAPTAEPPAAVVDAAASPPPQRRAESPAAGGAALPPPAPKKVPWVAIGAAAAAVLAIVFAVTTLGGADDEPGTLGDAEPGTTTAPSGAAVAVPLAAPPSIDGDSSDWPLRIEHETPELVFINSQIENGSVSRLGTDASADVLIGWDTSSLYLFASVRDDIVSQPNTGNQIWRGDAITINLSVGDQGAGASQSPDGNDFQLTLSPGDPTAGTSPESVVFSGNGQQFDSNRTSVAQLASTFSADGFAYLLEARIPWQVFGVADPASTGDFGALVAVFDNDGEREADDTDPLQAVILGNTPGARFQGPSTWGTLTLQR
jgi:hypothetical protein